MLTMIFILIYYFFIKDCHNLVTNASYTAKVKFEDDYPVMIPLKPV